MRWKILQWMKFLFRHSSSSRKLSRQKFHNELACVFTAHYASKIADWNLQQLTDGGILTNRNSANHSYCFLSNQKKVQILFFLHVICDCIMPSSLLPPLLLIFFSCGPKAGSDAGEEWPWQKPISTNFKIGALQLRSVTEIVPKWSFLCLSRSPIWYGFRVCSRVIRYCVKIALAFITKSLTFTKRAVHVTFDPRTYTQIHAPTVVQGEVNGAPPEFFYMLQYFETILPLVESLWSSCTWWIFYGV